ncbi:MAG: 2-oxoglutarate and iron-dependent oxygenase domain-containing protein, partial [Pseudomonadota bacterium]|nr:2-oxoglutarate and iron-dependent oxygenase domain-containing protein [Pseudomonadota bacterium]
MQIETVDFKASDAPQRLARSLRETGFAVLANHPISPERIDEAYDLWGGFFASETKSDYLRDYEKQDGYFPFKSEHAKDAGPDDHESCKQRQHAPQRPAVHGSRAACTASASKTEN